MDNRTKQMIKTFLALLALLSLAVEPANALDNLRIATASMTSSSVLYLLIAQKEGYFRAEGLNVEIINMRGEIAAKIAAAGEIDFFTQGFSGLAAAVRGVPLKILFAVDEKPDWDFIAQPQIKSFANLKGATVGILSLGGTVAVVTREMLRKNNLDPAKDVQLIVMGGNDMRFMSLRGRAIQATLLDAANSYRAQKEGFNKLAAAGDYVTHYFSGGIVAPQEKIRTAPETISRFMLAALKGYRFFGLRKEASTAYLMQFLRTKERDAAAAIYDANRRVVTRDGILDERILDSIMEDAKQAAGLKKELRAADFFDFSFARRAADRLKATGWNP